MTRLASILLMFLMVPVYGQETSPLTIELTGETTARTTMNASLVVGQTSCIWSSVTDLQRSN